MTIVEEEFKVSLCHWVNSRNNAETPEPIERVIDDKSIKWNKKSFVFLESPLCGFGEINVGIVLIAPELVYVKHVGKPHWD